MIEAFDHDAGPVLPPALLASHCRRLLAATGSQAPLALRAGLERLCSQWAALWQLHAGARAGWAHYRRCLQEAAAQWASLPAAPDSAALRQALAALVAAAAPQPARERRDDAPAPDAGLPVLSAPLFLVGAPLSGSGLLFEALSLAHAAWTPGGDAGGLADQLPGCSLEARGFESDRLGVDHATPDAGRCLAQAYAGLLRGRDGRRWHGAPETLALVDDSLRNALRVAFLAAAFPDARFVLVLREPTATVAAMLETWRAGTRISHPRLPDWGGGPWSLPLVPGWRTLEGRPLVEVAAAQYRAIAELLRSDLAMLPRERWMALDLDELLGDPRAALGRVCAFAGIDPEGTEDWVPPPATAARAVSPDNAAALAGRAAEIAAADARLRDQSDPGAGGGGAPAPSAAEPVAPAPSAAPASSSSLPELPADPRLRPLASVHTASFAEVLERAAASLLVSTYQAGKLVLVRRDGASVNTGFKEFRKPMGIAHAGGRLALGTAGEVRLFANVPAAAPQLGREPPPDAAFMPRASHVTGNIDIHELAFAEDGLWIVNTRFCCLCTLQADSSFVPRWMPPFLSALAPEDRCHLNGLAVRDGRVRYVTMLGRSDTPGGWRANKADGGLLMDLDGDRVVCEGLSMPHSPRWYRDRLWVLESGSGGLCQVDPDSGRRETVAELPGFTRGLDFIGPLAFVGLSQVRESAVFAKLPLTERLQERTCGVWVVNIESGAIVGFLRFEDAVQEIFAVTALPQVRYPELVLAGEPVCADTFVLPDAALARVPAAQRGA